MSGPTTILIRAPFGGSARPRDGDALSDRSSIERNQTALSNLRRALRARVVLRMRHGHLRPPWLCRGHTACGRIGSGVLLSHRACVIARVSPTKPPSSLVREARDVTPATSASLRPFADAHAVLALIRTAGAATHVALARSLLAAIERRKPSSAGRPLHHCEHARGTWGPRSGAGLARQAVAPATP